MNITTNRDEHIIFRSKLVDNIGFEFFHYKRTGTHSMYPIEYAGTQLTYSVKNVVNQFMTLLKFGIPVFSRRRRRTKERRKTRYFYVILPYCRNNGITLCVRQREKAQRFGGQRGEVGQGRLDCSATASKQNFVLVFMLLRTFRRRRRRQRFALEELFKNKFTSGDTAPRRVWPSCVNVIFPFSSREIIIIIK